MAYKEHDNEMEHFFSIVPRDAQYMELSSIEDIPLNVVKDSGVDVEEESTISVTELSSDDDGNVQKFYRSKGYTGIKFTIDVFMNNYDDPILLDVWDFNSDSKMFRPMEGLKKERYARNSNMMAMINDLYLQGIPVNVTTMAVDVPDGLYLITDVKSKKQTSKGSSMWSLTFESYMPATVINFTEQTTGVKKALKKYNKAKAKAAAKKTVKGKVTQTAKTISNQVLSKVDEATKKAVKELAWQDCKLSEIQYSKTKKTTACVKYMQKVLYKQGFMKKDEINGWYDKTTAKAVKEFQKKYKKKYNLTPNGTVDKATLKALKKV